MRFRHALAVSLVTLLAGCGGSNTTTAPVAPVATFDKSVVGYWVPQNSANEEFEFFSAPTDAPSANLLTGRTVKNGVVTNMFFWEVAAGAISISKVAVSCPSRPINLCPVVATTVIVANGANIENAKWSFDFDDNNDKKVDRRLADSYVRKGLDLARATPGQFFLARSEVFEQPVVGAIAAGKMTFGLVESGATFSLSTNIANDKVRSAQFAAGESAAVLTTDFFELQSGGFQPFPVKVWIDKVEMFASVGNGYQLQYERHRTVQLPAGTDRASVKIGSYEATETKVVPFAVIDKFVTGAQIRAGDVYYTMLPLDFNPEFVAFGAGNELRFTSATEGVISHVDVHRGTYSESRPFTWAQGTDGAIVLSFYGGLFNVQIKFIKPVNGGHQVLFAIPNPQTGDTTYLAHDLIKEATPVLNASNLPGRYSLLNSDGTNQLVTFHKDKTVSGAVGGFWFQDSNGDIISYECTDLQGQVIPGYSECVSAMDNVANLSLAHIRRIRFVAKDGDYYQSKYDSSFYGQRFQVFGRDYATISWTYRWTRLGNE
jgi:hypothetical protein